MNSITDTHWIKPKLWANSTGTWFTFLRWSMPLGCPAPVPLSERGSDTARPDRYLIIGNGLVPARGSSIESLVDKIRWPGTFDRFRRIKRTLYVRVLYNYRHFKANGDGGGQRLQRSSCPCYRWLREACRAKSSACTRRRLVRRYRTETKVPEENNGQNSGFSDPLGSAATVGYRAPRRPAQITRSRFSCK